MIPSTPLRRNPPDHRPRFASRFELPPARREPTPSASAPRWWTGGRYVVLHIGPTLADLIEGALLGSVLQLHGHQVHPYTPQGLGRVAFLQRLGFRYATSEPPSSADPTIPTFDGMQGPWGTRPPEQPRLLWALSVLGIPPAMANGALPELSQARWPSIFRPRIPEVPRILSAPSCSGPEVAAVIQSAAEDLYRFGANVVEVHPDLTLDTPGLEGDPLPLWTGLAGSADLIITSDAGIAALGAAWGTPTIEIPGWRLPCHPPAPASRDVARLGLASGMSTNALLHALRCRIKECLVEPGWDLAA